MDQVNVSMTDRLAGYVRKKVKSGRYNNASEVEGTAACSAHG
jgi:putative addiction module CopG family antidote